jgi:hypothetical protein
MQRGVPIFKTPSVTLTPITMGLFALKHASLTIYKIVELKSLTYLKDAWEYC